MTNDLLIKLCQEKLDAQKTYECWSLQNTYGKTAEELISIDLGYRQAQVRYAAATAAYEAALVARSHLIEG
jgi:hypothetical protein